jgi:hypothetical protein
MLLVTYKLFMLSVVMLSAVTLSVVTLVQMIIRGSVNT